MTVAGDVARRQALLVAAEVALTVVVLAGGVVLGRAFMDVVRADPGFDASDLLTVRLDLPGGDYGPDEARDFFVELQRRVRALPTVRSAAVATTLHPGSWHREVSIDGSEELEEVAVRYATPAYLETLQLSTVHGSAEEFSADSDGPAVALVNRAFARRHGGEEAVIGMTVRDVQEEMGRPFRVVGVFEDLPNAGIMAPSRPEVLLNHHQSRTRNGDMELVVRAVAGPTEVLSAVRQVVRTMDARLPLLDVATVEERLARASASLQVATGFFALLSICALLLAALGIAGVVAYSGAQRKREIGLRRALGAAEPTVRGEMMARTLRPALLGGVSGVVLVVLVGGAAGPLLPSSAEPSPLAVLAVLPVLAGVAVLAAFIPALRASRADPCEVMRAE